MSTPKMKMHRLIVADDAPKTFMIYAQTPAQARDAFIEKYVRISKATDLEIAAHVRAGLPILGEPDQSDPNQGRLDV